MHGKRKFPVFVDIRILTPPYERIVFELFHDVAPFTAENFRALCTGEKGVSAKTERLLEYKHCYFLPVKEGDSYVKGGAICHKTEKIGESIYCPHFPVDANELKHDKEGLLTMSKGDQEASNSCFKITLKADQSLDSSHVVFGKVAEGLVTLQKIRDYDFVMPVKIIDCGVLYNATSIPSDVIIRRSPSDAVVSCQGEQQKVKEDPIPIVLKLGMHCEGCMKKIKRFVRQLGGVQDVKADLSSNKLAVFGEVDPALVLAKLAEKTQKKVELISASRAGNLGRADRLACQPAQKKLKWQPA